MSDISGQIKKIFSKDIRAISRCISIIENEEKDSQEILNAIYHHTGNSYLIGITGPAGSGKSTLVDKLIKHIRTNKSTVAVVAVDPSSAFTGGALLGDRIRMQEHFTDAGVYIRSMATRGSSGGIAKKTKDVIKVLDAAQFDYIIIETVGIGQVEIDITYCTDVVVLVLMPGGGDTIQTMKAGILEAANIFVINKADKNGAQQLQSDLSLMLDLGYKGMKKPDIIQTIATQNKGIDELFKALIDYQLHLKESNNYLNKKRERILQDIKEQLEEKINQYVVRSINIKMQDNVIDDIIAKKTTPYIVAEKMLKKILT